MVISAIFDVCPRGSATLKMFAISKTSEVDPRGRGLHFLKMAENQKCLNYPGGEIVGQAYMEIFSVTPPLFMKVYFITEWSYPSHEQVGTSE